MCPVRIVGERDSVQWACRALPAPCRLLRPGCDPLGQGGLEPGPHVPHQPHDGPILGNSVPLALYWVDPTPGWDILVLAASITAFWIYPFLLKRGLDYNRLVITSVINLNFCIFWSCYFNGGILSPTCPGCS